MFTTLRARLMLWYVGSLIVFSLFFYLVVHIFAVPFGTELFILLFLLLASLGFYIIYNMTKSLIYLSERIRHISRKNLEERILDLKSGDEISELAMSFNNLLDNLHEAFSREQQFIADVAHELKTPLATLRSTLEISLDKNRKNEEYKKVIEDALGETNNISSTLKNVLDLAWAESHEVKRKSAIFDLSELVEEIADIAEKMAHSKQVAVASMIQEDIYTSGFKDKLARAILNIIENAVKYTQKGQITINLKKNHNHAFLTVTDTGQGISKDEIPHIFDRFYRGSKTDKILGSGLGLAISKSVVNLHQGYINIESKIQKGTTFTIILPISNRSS